ncbi:transposase [Kitasatospora purpeofusca]
MTSSTWPVEDVRARLARRAVRAVRPEVWAVDDTGFPKDGKASPGVARQYSGTLGKVGNCQIGISVHALSDTASCPLSWRLFLPESWDGPEAAARRAACRIPADARHRPKWQLALEMLDELAGTGLRPAVLVADAAYGANADFRHGLEDRHLAYVLQAKGEMTAHREDAEPYRPPYGGLGPRPLPRYRTRPLPLREHVLAAGRRAAGKSGEVVGLGWAVALASVGGVVVPHGSRAVGVGAGQRVAEGVEGGLGDLLVGGHRGGRLGVPPGHSPRLRELELRVLLLERLAGHRVVLGLHGPRAVVLLLLGGLEVVLVVRPGGPGGPSRAGA